MKIASWKLGLCAAAAAFPLMAFAGLDQALQAYEKGDYATMKKELLSCAETDPECAFNLGATYVNGLGVTPNHTEEFKWFLKAAQAGHALAQHNIGEMYRLGQGVNVDYDQAIQWYSKAIKQGAGEPMVSLAQMYLTGEGVQASPEKSFQLMATAANQGLAKAQHNLAIYYLQGIGTPVNKPGAVIWFRKAAEQGIADAQYNVGYFLANGIETTKDEKQAFVWLEKAAHQGVPNAQLMLSEMYGKGTVAVPKNAAWATRWAAAAARSGKPDVSEQAQAAIPGYLAKLTKLKVLGNKAQLLEKPESAAKVLGKLKSGQTLYRLEPGSSFVEAYSPEGHLVGFVKTDFVQTVEPVANKKPMQQANSNFPPRPAGQPGRTVCATKCFNAQCFRTYSDGRQVQFTARQVWDSFSNSYKFDSGSC